MDGYEKPISESQSLHIRLVDVTINHAHPHKDNVVVSYSTVGRDESEACVGSVTVPEELAKRLRIKVGDEFTVLMQKTISIYHLEKKALKEGR